MDRLKYLQLITETFFETRYPVASEPVEPMFDLQIKLFKQILIRKQKVAKREGFVTKDEFFLQCELALDQLKEFVSFKSSEELSRIYNYQKWSDGENYDSVYSVWDVVQPNWEDLKAQAKNDFENFDIDSFFVDLSGLNPMIKGEICNYDIEFLEDIIIKIDFETKKP
jgi:hypothetical protein